MGKLTTHVLDTSQGLPGRGIPVRLFEISNHRQLIVEAVTNDDGRCDAPLLDGDRFHPGTYELEFSVAAYYYAQPVATSKPPYLDTITLRVTLADDAHYHVPLLVSPWSYSTYRGS